MKEVTQGTLICGLRSRKYPGNTAYGIIISAACDLAQDKIDKIFHLTAVPLKEWLYSDVGFQVVTAGSANGYRKNILSLLEEFDLEWESIQTYSQEEIDTVFSAYKIPDKRKRTFLSQLEKLARMTKGSLTPVEKTTVYSDESKNVETFLGTLFNGGNSHYVFIPQKALTEPLLISMLQHEFGVQIKGRTDGTIEEYYKLAPISNALPVSTTRDKDFVFWIFKEYQDMLQNSAVYDSDDITIQALSQLNAPFWRRDRATKGFDYIFVDEMHLFNINEQHVFHYLTKNAYQKEIPICFALDYGQAIGDRGDVARDYIETTFANASRNQYKTVFRSSQEITDFCASISAAGALMFQQNFRDPYSIPTSGFTQNEDALCETPTLFMYPSDEAMVKSLKCHIDKIKRETQCSNKEIAVISFDSNLLSTEVITGISKEVGKPIRILRSRFSSENASDCSRDDSLIFSEPHNINGLEFAGVILLGVDDGRVPQTKNVGDVSENYIKFVAFNELYLSASRAKYRLVLLGNELHGTSPCLQYAIESKCLIVS